MSHKAQYFHGGNIKHYVEQWQQLTSDPEILDIVTGMHIPFDSKPRQYSLPTQIDFSDEELVVIDTEIQSLLAKHVIEPCNIEHDDFISTIFVRTKQNGKHRMILNLKPLNERVIYSHFKMDSLSSVLNLITKNCWMASVDMKDAYYSCPISPSHQKYLKFIWMGQCYKFTTFPNGLACCPRKFTKLLKPVFASLRQKGHMSTVYIDDTYLQGETPEDCFQNVVDTVNMLQNLGFIVHPEKSVLRPSQQIVFLGFVLDSVNMTIRLTCEKAQRLKNFCTKLLNKDSASIRSVAMLLGYMTASFPAVMYGPLHYRTLEMEKTKALKIAYGNYDACMTISQNAKNDIRWWQQSIDSSYNIINREAPTVVLYTDSSKTGWGGVLGNLRAGDNWTLAESQFHINYLEIMAVFLSLKSFRDQLRGQHVKVMTDNTTAVYLLFEPYGYKPF